MGLSKVFGDVRFLRGQEATIPTLEEGQPGFTKDTKRMFIGSDTGNIEIAKKDDVNGLVQRVDSRDEDISSINDSLAVTDGKANKLFVMRDPLAYLNSVEILCKFPARGQSTDAWTQGFSINQVTNEIYVAIQRNDGTTGLTIEVRNMDGSFKESKTLSITSGAFTESLPFFYNTNNELCFIVRTQPSSTYSIYNYTLGNLGSPVSISGTPYKAALDGNYFVTCDATSSVPYTLKNVYVYDFSSIQSGTPVLLNSFRVQNTGSALVEKAQGIALNNGYIFLSHGESNGQLGVSVYNTAGQLVNTYLYTKESVANVINSYYPGTIMDTSSYSYENESCYAYKGKLVVAQIINSVVYLFIHNSPTGYALETKTPLYRVDTGWLDVTLLNGAIVYASDTTPRIRRIGNEVTLDGAVKGLGATLGVEVIEFPSSFAPDRNVQPPAQVTSGGYQCNWQIQPNARAKIMNSKNPALDANTWYPFQIKWLI